MYLNRKRRFSAMLVAALFAMPGLASAQGPGARGGVDHPPVIQLGTLPSRPRLRRRVRGVKLRILARLTGRRVRAAVARIRAGRESAQLRLPPHDSYARGSPPSSSRRCPGGAAKSRPAIDARAVAEPVIVINGAAPKAGTCLLPQPDGASVVGVAR